MNDRKISVSVIKSAIRAMGFTANRNDAGEIWCRRRDCLHKAEHGFGESTWLDALATVRAEYGRGFHCCDELNGEKTK